MAERVRSQWANVPPFISKGKKREEKNLLKGMTGGIANILSSALHGIRIGVSELEQCFAIPLMTVMQSEALVLPVWREHVYK